MISTVDRDWRSGVGVRDLTDTDLQSSRNESMAVSDSTGETHVLIETLKRAQNMDTWSAVCDRALRFELAHAIDNYDVSFDRSDFDVQYTIPPVGWVEDQEPLDAKLVPPPEVDTDDRVIHFSTAPVVAEMTVEAVEEGSYETQKSVVEHGLRRQLGLLDE